MKKTRAMVQACGMVYKSVTHSLLQYGSDSWLVTGAMLKVLEGFYHRSDRRIMGMNGKRKVDGEWEYPTVVAAV